MCAAWLSSFCMHATMGRGERYMCGGRRACPLVRQAVAVGLLTRADAERAALLARATRPCATCAWWDWVRCPLCAGPTDPVYGCIHANDYSCYVSHMIEKRLLRFDSTNKCSLAKRTPTARLTTRRSLSVFRSDRTHRRSSESPCSTGRAREHSPPILPPVLTSGSCSCTPFTPSGYHAHAAPSQL